MDADQNTKRQYLRQEIIDQGYDPQDFGEFLIASSTNQESAVDISSWNLTQLKNLVAQFKALRTKTIKPQKNKSQISKTNQQESSLSQSSPTKIEQKKQQQKIIEKKQSIQIKQKQIKRQKQHVQQTGKYHQINYQTKYQVYSQVINCQIASPSSLLSADVQINISKYDKKQGGIFQKSYVVYFVTTPFLKKTVQRRYSDFLWLKQTLQALHPGLPIPPIAKKGQFRRYDDKHLVKRMLILQMFLNKLLQIPQIKADQVFQNFLKFDDIVMFEKFKSEFRKGTYAIPLNKIKNMKGKLTLAIEPKINSFLSKAQKNLIETQPQLKKIFKQFKNAATMLQTAATSLTNIGQICRYLDKKEEIFRKQSDLKYLPNNLYTLLQEMTQNYGSLLLQQAKTFRREVYAMIKYQYLNTTNMLESFDKLVYLQSQYQETKGALQKKKQRLFEQGNRAKWGNPQLMGGEKPKKQTINLILPKETAELGRLRQQYALYNFYLYEEVHRHYLKNNTYMGQHLQKLAEIHSRINNESMILWVDLLTRIMSMKEGKSIQNTQLVGRK